MRNVVAMPLLVAVILLAGCAGPAATTSPAASSSVAPSTPPPTTVADDSCGLQRQVAVPYASSVTSMTGPLDAVAQRILNAVNDSIAPGAKTFPDVNGKQPRTATWATATGGQLMYNAVSLGDESISGLKWPAGNWDYHTNAQYPGRGAEYNNHTLAKDMSEITGIPVELVSSFIIPEPAENENEFTFSQLVGDLPPWQFANGKVSYASTNFTSLAIHAPYQLPAGFTPKPQAELEVRATSYAKCYAKTRGPLPTLTLATTTLHVLNGTLVEVFGFKDPDAKARKDCFDERLISVLVDVKDGVVRDVHFTPRPECVPK